MVPEAAVAMLACARIGAPHSVVFAGFSAEALASRIEDAKCKVLLYAPPLLMQQIVLTADEGKRGGRAVPLKVTVDDAILKAGGIVQHVLVLKHTGGHVPWKDGRDI